MPALSLKEIERLLLKPDPALWALMTRDEVATMRRVAASHLWWRSGRNLNFAALFGAAVGMVWPLLSSKAVSLVDYLPLGLLGLLACMTFAFLGALTAMMLVATVAHFVGDPETVLLLLRPLSEDPIDCSVALAIARTSAQAETYRRQAAGTGRDILKVDLALMREMQAQDLQRELDTQHQIECQALHDVAHAHQQAA